MLRIGWAGSIKLVCGPPEQLHVLTGADQHPSHSPLEVRIEIWRILVVKLKWRDRIPGVRVAPS
jgi:hypothetical protein